MQGNIPNGVLPISVGEAASLEVDASVGYLGDCILRREDSRLLVNHFCHTSSTCCTHGEHDKNHGQHHQ